jgi:ABC-type sulfate/molybdate transport systems ATPase subunit
MTTHDAAQAVALCDRVVVIAKGVAAFDAPSAGLDFRSIPV